MITLSVSWAVTTPGGTMRINAAGTYPKDQGAAINKLLACFPEDSFSFTDSDDEHLGPKLFKMSFSINAFVQKVLKECVVVWRQKHQVVPSRSLVPVMDKERMYIVGCLSRLSKNERFSEWVRQ
ncbi:hypothetical protein G7K_0846-t1 [Saitoella complicata NRRL Y-17804]|uniref:Uncharacterized protein n=1 Tax=Saitoella complicata (strain BCRC 22490 / CBS 7301 / JCM 7358 / NBRC 10748 / NRRL Y-17804) TaxID=698492 RepID=A0A0E9N9W6_SAICN|nr:hypothetical protein G7K_0846-t1 [Saitoella complicata NRRL Y-17804]